MPIWRSGFLQRLEQESSLDLGRASLVQNEKVGIPRKWYNIIPTFYLWQRPSQDFLQIWCVQRSGQSADCHLPIYFMKR